MGCGNVFGGTEIDVNVIEFPFVFQERMAGFCFPGCPVNRVCQPAVVINPPITEDFKILSLVTILGRRVCERIDHADSLNWNLRRPIHGFGFRKTSRLQDRWGNINDVMPLRSDFALRLDSLRPVNDEAISCAAIASCNLLGPGKRSISGDGPTRCVMTVGLRSTEFINLLQDIGNRFRNAVEIGHFVEQAVHRSFGTGAVVTNDVENESVIHLSQVFNCFHNPADFEVCIRPISSKHFHLASEQAFFVGTQRGPVLDRFGLGGQNGVLWNDSQFLLSGERFFTQLVPALIKLSTILFDPFFRSVMGSMRSPGSEIREERLVRRQRLLVADPLDRLIGEVGHQMVIRIVRKFDPGHPVIEAWRPLVGFTTDESVELVEARARWPAVCRSGRTHFPCRCFMRFSKRRCAVAVQAKHFGKGSDAIGTLTGLSCKCGCRFRDRTHIVHVVVTTAEKCSPRGRAERCRVEFVVLQTTTSEPFQCRHLYRTTEGTGLTKSHVVDQNDQHIGGTSRRFHLELWRSLNIASIKFRDERWDRFGDWQVCPINRRGLSRAERDRKTKCHHCGHQSAKRNSRHTGTLM